MLRCTAAYTLQRKHTQVAVQPLHKFIARSDLSLPFLDFVILAGQHSQKGKFGGTS